MRCSLSRRICVENDLKISTSTTGYSTDDYRIHQTAYKILSENIILPRMLSELSVFLAFAGTLCTRRLFARSTSHRIKGQHRSLVLSVLCLAHLLTGLLAIKDDTNDCGFPLANILIRSLHIFAVLGFLLIYLLFYCYYITSALLSP